jgi:hypothetical protein
VEITLAQDDSAWLNQCLQQAGFRVSAIAPKQKTLKEFFLSITGLRHAEGPSSINQTPASQAGLQAPQDQASATQAGLRRAAVPSSINQAPAAQAEDKSHD